MYVKLNFQLRESSGISLLVETPSAALVSFEDISEIVGDPVVETVFVFLKEVGWSVGGM